MTEHDPRGRSQPAAGSDPTDSERLALALAAGRLGEWSWDAKRDVLTYSARAREICGLPDTSPLNRVRTREVVHPDDRELVRRVFDAAVFNGREYTIEHRVVSATRQRWVRSSGRPRYDAKGELLGVFGVLQDVSTDRFLLLVDDAVRHLTEPDEITSMAARVLGQHLGVERCAYAFVEDDQDTFHIAGNYTNGLDSIVGSYRFREFSAECLRLMRAGKPFVVDDSERDERVSEDDRRAYRQTGIAGVICASIIKRGRFVAAMAVHTKAPRAWQPWEVDLVQQVASRCWESIERARIERERKSLLEAAQSANRAKDEFLAMLGHELRNPLAPILTALQIMKLKDEDTSARERTVIERQVSHLTRLVEDLLDVSAIARGKVALKRELIELGDVVQRAIEVASPLLEQRKHTLGVQMPERGLLVHGDMARLTQVVANLLTNAGKYTPSGGTITISAAVRGSEVVLRVADNGVGMTPEVLAHAFDLFVQGRQASDRARGGLGLGLSIVKSLVERHGGAVSAHSDGVGRGSELVVRLPLAERDAASLSAQVPPSSTRVEASPALTILVVDDNDDAAEMMAEALTFHGCRVHVAHDGPAALRLGRQHAVDIAFLDIGLPVMDGYELARRLRELPNTAPAWLVAVTGYGQESDRRRAVEAGFQQHLVKPVDLAAIANIVKQVESQRPTASAASAP